MMDTEELLQNLPHTFPFRMIDRILEIEPGKRAVVLKNVSINEPYLQGHYPREPVMPSILILEALAQTGGIAFHSSFGKEEKGVPFLARIDEFRLKGKVVPGDSMILEAEIEHIFSNLAKVKVWAKVKGEIVAEGVVVLAKALSFIDHSIH
ncbi:MAG: 3-hydroxyacyl-ACP dehydratase FabZ [Deltaproteobacteria bacterium]|nr:3-hydroxyacyl-ACP dehydratase FabZ [Deltaproteobacteria bacterium]